MDHVMINIQATCIAMLTGILAVEVKPVLKGAMSNKGILGPPLMPCLELYQSQSNEGPDSSSILHQCPPLGISQALYCILLLRGAYSKLDLGSLEEGLWEAR
jgi:hypothetical protein